MTRPDGSRWPTAEQELLLRAALLPAPRAVQAWDEWLARVDLSGPIDDGSFRLLPLVCRNLERQQAVFSEAERLRGIYRHTWLRNQLMVQGAVETLDRFAAAGIETMILKGLPLALRAYGELGARPMNDIDVLVPEGKARKALAVLLDAGWRSPRHSVGHFGPTMATFHATGLNRGKASLDLHWHVLQEGNFAGADASLWAAAIDISVGGRNSRALCPADMLLHVLAHGARWDPVPPIRWVADAVLLVTHEGDAVDWDRFVAQAERFRLTLATGSALGYLAESFASPVPEAVLRELDASPKGWLERWDFGAQDAPRTFLHQGSRELAHYMRLSRGRSPLRRAANAPEFMRETMMVDSAWKAPAKAARRYWRQRRAPL